VGPKNQDFLGPEMAMREASAVWAQKAELLKKNSCLRSLKIQANMLIGAQIDTQRSAADKALSRGRAF
jgi:hypothetical protein